MTSQQNQDADEVAEEELSLDRLSEAYAEVLRQQSGSAQPGDAPIETEPTEDIEPEEEPEESHDDDSACPITPESIVESILFVGAPRGEKLTAKTIASVMRDVSAADVRSIAKKLNRRYEQENAAWRISLDADNLRMVIAKDLEPLQNEFFGRNRAVALSQSAIDILAVVAYRQPVNRDEIEKAINKSAGGVLSQLVRRDLLQTLPEGGSSRKKLYGTTERFLKLFHLSGIEDLPHAFEAALPGEFDQDV